MRISSKTIAIMTLVFVLGAAVAFPAFALNLQLDYPPIPGTDPTGQGRTLNELVNTDWLTVPNIVIFIFQATIWIGALLALLSLVYVGFRFATSAGDPGQRREAKDRLRGVGFGILILASSFLLVDFINPELSSLRFFQQGVCSETRLDKGRRPEGCDNTGSMSFGDVIRETSGIVLYDQENFGGNGHLVLGDMDDVSNNLTYEPPLGKSNDFHGGLNKAGNRARVQSLRLAPGCEVRLYDAEKNKGAFLLVTNHADGESAVGGEVVVYNKNGSPLASRANPVEGYYLSLPLDKDQWLSVPAIREVFARSNEDGAPREGDWWENDIEYIKFVSCETKGIALYEEDGYQDRMMAFWGETPFLQGSFLGSDQASSMHIYGDDIRVRLYEDGGFGDQELTIEIRGGDAITCKSSDLEDGGDTEPKECAIGRDLVRQEGGASTVWAITRFGSIEKEGGGRWDNDVDSIIVEPL